MAQNLWPLRRRRRGTFRQGDDTGEGVGEGEGGRVLRLKWQRICFEVATKSKLAATTKLPQQLTGERWSSILSTESLTPSLSARVANSSDDTGYKR